MTGLKGQCKWPVTHRDDSLLLGLSSSLLSCDWGAIFSLSCDLSCDCGAILSLSCDLSCDWGTILSRSGFIPSGSNILAVGVRSLLYKNRIKYRIITWNDRSTCNNMNWHLKNNNIDWQVWSPTFTMTAKMNNKNYYVIANYYVIFTLTSFTALFQRNVKPLKRFEAFISTFWFHYLLIF